MHLLTTGQLSFDEKSFNEMARRKGAGIIIDASARFSHLSRIICFRFRSDFFRRIPPEKFWPRANAHLMGELQRLLLERHETDNQYRLRQQQWVHGRLNCLPSMAVRLPPHIILMQRIQINTQLIVTLSFVVLIAPKHLCDQAATRQIAEEIADFGQMSLRQNCAHQPRKLRREKNCRSEQNQLS